MNNNRGKIFDVFLSHAHIDAEAVESLATRLTDEAGFLVWLDRWVLIPGEHWQQEMALGLDKAKTCVACIGQHTPKGWFREEIERALNRQAKDNSFRVIPLILPNGDPSLVDSFLELRTWVDFRKGLNDNYAFHVLRAGIEGVPPGRNPYMEIADADKVGKEHFLSITKKDLTESQIKKFTILIEGSAKLLEADRLSGSWGKTISKYMELTQDEGKWSEEDVFKYLLTGSLTHTYHALNGLCQYYRLTNKFFNPHVAFNILKYIKTWRHNFGAFATPVTNFDGSWGNPEIMNGQDANLFRNQIPQLMRHTSCGILAINRLLELRNISRKSSNLDRNAIHKWEAIIETLDNYNLRALQVLAAYSGLIEMGDPSIWGKVRYTPAYVILAVDEGLEKYSNNLSDEYLDNLKRIKSSLIEFAFNNALESDERFLCQYSNKKAFYYYTLLFLENYLSIEEFTDDSRAFPFCRKLIQALTDVIISTSGLSFGTADIANKPWLNFADIGVTARFLFVLSKYSTRFEITTEFSEAFKTGLQFILDNVFDFEYSTRNFLTHGWEAILKLIAISDDVVKKKLKRNLCHDTILKSKELKDFIATISGRDFHGREPIDQQSKFFELLVNDPTFSKIIGKFKEENKDDFVRDWKALKEQLEINFNRDSFMSFLNKNKIPFREDESLENMIDTTLFQFQF